jgi:hypothetical protein
LTAWTLSAPIRVDDTERTQHAVGAAVTTAIRPSTYAAAGVDIDAGERLVRRIAPLARRTRRPEILAGVGGFAALARIPKRYREPLLVTCTDGVGTKLRIAFALDRHDTIGIDLVAMSVNDLLTVGAEPLLFLDYFATGALDVRRGTDLVRASHAGVGSPAAVSSAARPRSCRRSTNAASTTSPALPSVWWSVAR